MYKCNNISVSIIQDRRFQSIFLICCDRIIYIIFNIVSNHKVTMYLVYCISQHGGYSMKLLVKDVSYPEIVRCMFCDTTDRQSIFASISSKEITKNMVRAKSSNIWSYAINVRKAGDKTGDMYIQFKGENGGPGDVYVYYDIPVNVYRKFVSAPSKGHYFWIAIRNDYLYRKLSGDKRGKLPNAVN